MLVFITVKYSFLTNDFSHKRYNMRRGPIPVLRGGGDQIKRARNCLIYRIIGGLSPRVSPSALRFRHLSFCHRRLKRRSRLVGFLIWFEFRQSFVSPVVIYISYFCVLSFVFPLGRQWGWHSLCSKCASYFDTGYLKVCNVTCLPCFPCSLPLPPQHEPSPYWQGQGAYRCLHKRDPETNIHEIRRSLLPALFVNSLCGAYFQLFRNNLKISCWGHKR